MNVTLIEYTPNPEKIVAAAAKLCYSDSGCENIMEGLDNDKTAAFVKMLSDMGHESPIEHVSFTFGIEGVSRALLAQITRHRHASFSVQSQRYVKKDNFVYIIPPAISEDKEINRLYTEAWRILIRLIIKFRTSFLKNTRQSWKSRESAVILPGQRLKKWRLKMPDLFCPMHVKPKW